MGEGEKIYIRLVLVGDFQAGASGFKDETKQGKHCVQNKGIGPGDFSKTSQHFYNFPYFNKSSNGTLIQYLSIFSISNSLNLIHCLTPKK